MVRVPCGRCDVAPPSPPSARCSTCLYTAHSLTAGPVHAPSIVRARTLPLAHSRAQGLLDAVRSLDAYRKLPRDLSESTLCGALLTALAALAVAFLVRARAAARARKKGAVVRWSWDAAVDIRDRSILRRCMMAAGCFRRLLLLPD